MGDDFLYDIPGEHVAYATIESVAAGDATEDQVIFVAPIGCVVTGVSITPDAAATGNTTNTKHLNVDNKGADGTGTTEIAQLDLVTGTDLVEADESALVVSGTLAQRTLVKGDVLMMEIEQIGSGIAIARSLIKTTFNST